MARTGERAKLDRRILIVFPGLMLAMMLAALDQTIVATSLPTIVTDLGGLTHISWVATAYLLTSCVSTPIYGKLGDQFGRKRLFQFAIVLFLIGSALCGMARNMTELVIFRGLQGIGAGGLMVNSQAVIGDLVAPADRGRYQGFMQSVFAFATVAGPLIGGVLTQDASWRWVFYVNLPIGAIALVVIGLVLKLPPRTGPKPRSTGRARHCSQSACAALILLTSSGGQSFAWLSPQALLLVVLAIGALVAFVFVERRAPEPLFPLRLFRNPVIRITGPLIFVVGFGMLGISTFMPLYQQIVDGVSPTMSGLRLAPLMLAMMVISVACGQTIARIGELQDLPEDRLRPAGHRHRAAGPTRPGHLLRLPVPRPRGCRCRARHDQPGDGARHPERGRGQGHRRGDLGQHLRPHRRFVLRRRGVRRDLRGETDLVVATTIAGQRGRQFSRSGINISRAQIDALPAALRTEFLGGFANALHDVFLGGIVVAVIGFLLAIQLPEVPLRRRKARATQNRERLRKHPERDLGARLHQRVRRHRLLEHGAVLAAAERRLHLPCKPNCCNCAWPGWPARRPSTAPSPRWKPPHRPACCHPARSRCRPAGYGKHDAARDLVGELLGLVDGLETGRGERGEGLVVRLADHVRDRLGLRALAHHDGDLRCSPRPGCPAAGLRPITAPAGTVSLNGSGSGRGVGRAGRP